jgi:glycosidase
MPSPEKNILQEITATYPFLGIEQDSGQLGKVIGLPPPAWIHEGPLYEIFVRSFSADGSFAQVLSKLAYLKELGIKTIWLMPIHPIGYKGRKGTFGSPYAIKDYMAIDRHYGSAQDLRNLINAIHDHDMKIILDMVANHTALDHVWLKQNPNLFCKDKKGNPSRRISDWSDIVDLNYQHPETGKNILEVLKYWIQEFDVDGYRCDVAGMVPLDFWEHANRVLMDIKNDIFLLAEWESSKLHVNAFNATYDWTLYLVLKEIFNKKRSACDCLEWVQQKTQLYPENALPLRFTENHDFPRTIETFGKDSFYPFVALLFCLPGIPLLYAGQELGALSTPSLFEKEVLPWNNSNRKIFNFYKRLISARKKYRALSCGSLHVLRHNQHDKVVAFNKQSAEQNVLVILNFSAAKTFLKIEADHNLISRELLDLLNDQLYLDSDIKRGLDLNPYDVLVLTQKEV